MWWEKGLRMYLFLWDVVRHWLFVIDVSGQLVSPILEVKCQAVQEGNIFSCLQCDLLEAVCVGNVS